ncbi:GAF domain-containing protein [Rhodovulum sp. PH10]|uniref:GAF domain-containing protein n=1 Tax=Rhodovulum sp. PH10 TaxID=1187851 RepID=UPI00192C3911|nr:GAF domain-containing protein [Rhodovulum sp. PH10]
MTNPSILPVDEHRRLAAVRRYDILDTPPDGSFDRITALAARRFDVPIAIVSIVDEDRIWFKSHHGLDVDQIDREPGLCASAILSEDPWILTDARADPRSLANPLVAGEFGLRFYAGVPLHTADGFNLGMLCVIAREPRAVDGRQIADLNDLAAIVVDQMELRLAARRAITGSSAAARALPAGRSAAG